MYVMPEGPPSANLMIIQGAVGYQDVMMKLPFQGSDGMELNKMLIAAGTERAKCFITSFLRQQLTTGKLDDQYAKTKKAITLRHQPLYEKMALPSIFEGKSAVEKDIDLIKPKVIVVFDNAVLHALTGNWGIKQWRGSIVLYTSPNGHKCVIIPTYSPAFVRMVWKERPTVVSDLTMACNLSQQDKLPEELKYDFIIDPSFSKVEQILTKLYNQACDDKVKLAIDIETRGGHIACLGIAWSELSALCIPFMRAAEGEAKNYWLEWEETRIVWLLYKLLTHPNIEVVGQNFIYDAQYIYRFWHFISNCTRDTMIAQHSIFSNQPKDLSYLASIYCTQHVYWKDESKNWDPKLGEKQLWIYNCKDCVVTYDVDTQQQLSIDSMSESWPKLREVHDFQQSLYYPVLQSMNIGLRIDDASKKALTEEITIFIKDLNDKLLTIVGHPLNIKSPKQMVDFFYRELAQRKILNRETGNPTVNEEALQKIASREILLKPVVDIISDLRSSNVFKSTFLEAQADIDNRMRCQFKVAGTKTYRFASSSNAFDSGMNLQNIPTGDEDGHLPNIRKLFITDEGQEFFDVDLDSADLRIVVSESDCKEMKIMLSEGKKPYVEVAKEYYKDPTIDKHHPSYKTFKALCHATNYLGTPQGVSGRIGLIVAEVDRIQKWYFEKFPEIKLWQEKIISDVHNKRYVENVFGYRLNIFDRIQGTILNEIIAWIPQSTVGCLINRGYKNIHEKEKDIQVLLQVHDSLGGQYPIETRENHIKAIIKHCSVTLPYKDPIIIPVGIKTSPISWGHCD